MDFTFDAEQVALADVARRAMDDVGGDFVRQMADDDRGSTPEFWDRLVSLGWTSLLVPDEGAGLLEMCIVLEQMGRVPLPGPFFSSAVMATLAARALDESALLDELAGGASRGTVAVLEQGHGDPLDTVRTRAVRRGSGWELHGSKPVVIDGHTADWAIVVALGEEGARSFLVRDLPGELVPSLDPTRKLARVVLDGTPAEPIGPAGNHADLWRRVLDDISVALAAELVGVCDRALEQATGYANERIVFDQPIATFQVVRHRLVDMFHALELARVGVHYAAWSADAGEPDHERAAAMASAYASEAAVKVTGDDIQLHGGVGFTWANDAHLLFKRAKQNETLMGGSGHQWQRLGAAFTAL